METPMRKNFFARMAHLVREITSLLIPVLSVIKLILEIVDKVANCNDRELQVSIQNAR